MTKISKANSKVGQTSTKGRKSSRKSMSKVSPKEVCKTSKKIAKQNKAYRISSKRTSKTYDQMIALNKYFEQDPNWGRDTVQKCKRDLGLKTSVIYKWGYDQKIAIRREQKQEELLLKSQRPQVEYLTDKMNNYNLAVDAIIDQMSKTPKRSEESNCPKFLSERHTDFDTKSEKVQEVSIVFEQDSNKLADAAPEIDFKKIKEDEFQTHCVVGTTPKF